MSHDGMSQGQERAFLDNYHQKSAHLITERCKVPRKLLKNCFKKGENVKNRSESLFKTTVFEVTQL